MFGDAAASSLLSSRFPHARCAWLTGSAATGDVTATSDVDLVVVADDDAPSFRETVRQDSLLVELFVHSPTSLRYWYERERRENRCTLAHMVATGVALTDSGPGVQLQRDAELHVEAGPAPRSQADIDALRYGLSAALDDLTDAREARAFVAMQVMELAGELRLAHADSWTGSGKWLHRWLRHVDSQCADDLAAGWQEAANGQIRSLVEVADRVLNLTGGRLQAGYRLG